MAGGGDAGLSDLAASYLRCLWGAAEGDRARDRAEDEQVKIELQEVAALQAPLFHSLFLISHSLFLISNFNCISNCQPTIISIY